MKILVPLDFSSVSGRVLDSAARLARGLHAQIVLLYVFEPVATYIPTGVSMDIVLPDPGLATPGEDCSVFAERLEQLAVPLRSQGLEVTVRALIGLPADDILDQASSEEADYIVLGSHGRGALYHLFSGSVVNAVLKRSLCPVVVVPVREE